MRVASLLLMFLAVVVAQDDFQDKVVTHNREWGVFVRDYFGCPAKAKSVDECSPALGRLDRTQFRKSCLSAAELYGFKDKEVCSK
jgi:hypothetical protein